MEDQDSYCNYVPYSYNSYTSMSAVRRRELAFVTKIACIKCRNEEKDRRKNKEEKG